jgi:hypothetical protein
MYTYLEQIVQHSQDVTNQNIFGIFRCQSNNTFYGVVFVAVQDFVPFGFCAGRLQSGDKVVFVLGNQLTALEVNKLYRSLTFALDICHFVIILDGSKLIKLKYLSALM